MQIQYAAVWYKNQLHWSMQTNALYVYNKTYSKEIPPGATPSQE